MTALLSGQGLILLRGDCCLIKDLDFALGAGELLLVNGANGSGKTSLLRAIAGLLPLEDGELRWRGEWLRPHDPQFRGDIAWLSHRVGFKNDLDLVENLRFESSLRASHSHRLESVLERLSLASLTALPFRALSAGQQRRVALARLLLSTATLWMMDEPFTNLDRDGQALVRMLLEEHLAEGGSAIVATHQPVEVDAPIIRVSL